LSQCGQAKRGVQSAGKRHAQNAAAALIHDAGQVEPAFLGGDKGSSVISSPTSQFHVH
jgi:hypothetical protein